ncbi:TonB-dependent receptor plug domain-containing protein [Parasphingopyxis sp.]|uniref:TonB-dependent receptor plug domain-containing protein n=1 Tax=Parasphingopyxis sp. TaxID=1920299 RepID=UPI0032EE5CD2
MLTSASALALTYSVVSAPAAAQSQTGDAAQPAPRQGNTIVVTATRRTENLLDVAVAVQALGEEELDQLGVTVFEDYLEQLPGVTAGGGGPGQNTIYIRGLASTTPNLTTAGVAGLAPNVALYLDEQPLSQPGRNLDVYAADLERIEVLSGPQGALFGASSQAGTVRLITNKPRMGVWEANVQGEVSFTDGGDPSQRGEVMVNVPVADFLAFRGVAFLDHQGGYIDNVPGRRNAFESARFRPAGTVRDNGVPVSTQRQGFQANQDLSLVNFQNARVGDLVENDFNDATYAGFRLTGRLEFNDFWSLTVSHMRQTLDTEGVFFDDPELDDYEIQRFEEDNLYDRFDNTAWTLEGRLGFLDLVYSGAYTERDADQRVDYSDYLFVGQYLPYYICDGSVSYPGGQPTGTCQAPSLFVQSNTHTEVFTQELRFSTPHDYWISAQIGGFNSDLTLEERNDFTYPGSQFVQGFSPGIIGFVPNFPFTTG